MLNQELFKKRTEFLLIWVNKWAIFYVTQTNQLKQTLGTSRKSKVVMTLSIYPVLTIKYDFNYNC